jgi:hypothetical protein
VRGARDFLFREHVLYHRLGQIHPRQRALVWQHPLIPLPWRRPLLGLCVEQPLVPGNHAARSDVARRLIRLFGIPGVS